MEQTITLVTSTLGSVDLKVSPSGYPNTFNIGAKRIDFSNILPPRVDIRKCDFHIILWDGRKMYCEIVVGSSTHKGWLIMPAARHEEMYIQPEFNI